MRFLVISSAPVLHKGDQWEAYLPYVREMDIWFGKAEKVQVICPTAYDKPLLTQIFKKQDIEVLSVPMISFGGFACILKSLLLAPYIVIKIMLAMHRTDHIHLRCPGNMGLLGCIAQVFFPLKAKTAKYAGNWDPKSKQPWSYKLQKWILSNENLTKNMRVLVYGEWPKQSKNIKSFFTATYTETDKTEIPQRSYDLPLRFLFVGSLVKGKRPEYALELFNELFGQNGSAELHFYGDGPLRGDLAQKITDFGLKKTVFIHGSQDAGVLENAYKNCHFLLLPSKSEGWPKVVAEAMWWGAIPIVTPVSCVPWMLGEGERGILINGELKEDIATVKSGLGNKTALQDKAQNAQNWSRQFTLERFDEEIKKLF